MNTLTTLPLTTGVEAAERRRAAEHRRALRVKAPVAGPEITVRTLAPADRGAVERIAQRDSRPAPAGDLLGAEADGVLVAAMSPRTGAVVADPFSSAAGAAVELLRLRVRQLTGPREPASRLRRMLSGRGHASLAGSPPGAGGRLLRL